MGNTTILRKGLDIRLKGKAARENVSATLTGTWSLTPGDYHGIAPRPLVKPGDRVKAGSPLMTDKNHPEIQFVSAVSGTVTEVIRGEKRKLLNLLVQPDEATEYLEFPIRNPLEMTGDEVREVLLESGLWPFLKQRPYDLIANPRHAPLNIFVTGFDSHPLAPDYAYLLQGHGAELQAGLDALSRLTTGKVYLGLPAGCLSSELTQALRVEIRYFEGPHPAGNVGVHINHTAPVNKHETVYTTNALDVLAIGRFFLKGKVDLTRLVAVTGPEVRKPQYVRCKPGTPVSALLDGNTHREIPLRLINGNALTGTTVAPDGFLSAYAHQITVLREGTGNHEFLGWVMPRLDLFSTSRTYFSWLVSKLLPAKQYEPDTRVLGGERALIMSNEYDKVFPMDILPEHLIRACITRNLEKMEDLGIYEVAPEDFALCEFVCTSKIELQQVVRDALDFLKLENGA